ncbi:MAG: putative baseplate assembly protein [Rhodobacteraceae bacterium]|nr:putative baseplate assembly protein [Paracoccaceae bacterium]
MDRLRSFLDERRERLAASDANLNGIAGIEVDPDDQTRLRLRFVKALPGPGGIPATPLEPGDLTITGGDRIRGIGVTAVATDGDALVLTVSAAGDFSPYTLTIDADVPGFDPALRAIVFSFKVHCDTGSDCAPGDLDSGEVRYEPRLDYLARDYDSYRRMLLDRLAVTAPELGDRNPASMEIALVEWLAYLGDALAQKLDAVETEYSLETARLRPSAARHARLTGYRMHNGASARVLAQLTTGGDFVLVADQTAFVTGSAALNATIVGRTAAARAAQTGAVVFEPLEDTQLRVAHNEIGLHAWGDPDAILRAGSTTAWLQDPDSALTLAAGDLLVLEETRSPDTGRAADADPAHRQAVRLVADPVPEVDALEEDGPLPVLRIEWHPEDALRFDLCIGARSAEEGPLAMARGNLVLADHGMGLAAPEPLGAAASPIDPEAPPAPGEPDERKGLAELDRPKPFAPVLAQRELTFSAGLPDPAASATALQEVDPAEAKPEIALNVADDAAPWTPLPDLLGASPEAPVFVAEVAADGKTHLRFGRGHGEARSPHGRTPPADKAVTASYRVGTGRRGNIGADALAHLATDAVAPNILAVRNPLPATGGMDRETIAEVRQRAPVAFREQRRAVTLADYETLLTAHPKVQRAFARKRWLGSWSAIFLSVDRTGGLEVDDAFRTEMLRYLEPFRMMGHDLTIDAPIHVPLRLTMAVCVDPDHFAADVQRALERRFSAGLTETGQPGFFHPDALSFGAVIYLSRIYEAALAVPGVSDVTVTAFDVASATTRSALEDGVLRFGPREIPVLSDDPNRPDAGTLTITTEGGR